MATTEKKVVEYVPAGVQVTPTRDDPTLDPELAKIRDAEAKRNDVPINPEPAEPTIDDELVKAREADLKKAADYVKAADSDAVKAPSDTASKTAKRSSSKSSK